MTTDLKQIAKQAVQTGTQITTFKGAKSSEIQTFLERFKGQISQALPSHLTSERMIAMAVNMITQNPKLAECNLPSLIGAIMQASILGFQPVPILGECYFVPYAGNIQFQIGYKGFIRLAQRSGELTDIYAECVYENDLFSYKLGLHRDITHIPATGERGKIVNSYAVAHFKSGGYAFAVLSLPEIEKLRLRSPSQKNGLSGAWITDYDAMAKAKAIKQLAKYLPLSVEILNAVESDGGTMQIDSFEHGILKPETIDYITGEIIEEDEVIDAK